MPKRDWNVTPADLCFVTIFHLWLFRQRRWRTFSVSPEAALHSTLNQTPEQGKKWETNLTVYMVWHSNSLIRSTFFIRPFL